LRDRQCGHNRRRHPEERPLGRVSKDCHTCQSSFEARKRSRLRMTITLFLTNLLG
jgi:hypothetical protein